METMETYIIERHIPGIENMSADEWKAIARKSNGVLADLGSQLRWIHSYVMGGKTYCVYEAADEELIREHAKLGGFPCNVITPVRGMLEPAMGQL